MSPDRERLAAARRREATRAALRYFAIFFVIFLFLGGLTAYTVRNARSAERDNRAVRVDYCRELEKLKAQNREDVAHDIRTFPRTLRLLHLRPTPELRRAAEESWRRKLRRNAPRPCPYG